MVQHVRRRAQIIAPRLIGWLFLLATLLGPCLARAEPFPWTLSRYQHTAWTRENGAPTGVTSLAQTPDGYLWIGSNSGLYRFDGLHFEHIETVDGQPLPTFSVFSLYASADGGLWIGYEFGGISVIRGGHLTQYGPKDGLPEHVVINAITQDRQGVMWCASIGILYRLVDGRWEKIGSDVGIKGNRASFVRIARNGAFWVGTPAGLFYRAPGAKQFVALDEKGFVIDIEEAPDGSMWVSYAQKLIERWITTTPGPTLEPGTLTSPRIGYIHFDHQGGLWINGLGDGIHHITAEAISSSADLSALSAGVESFNAVNGLSSDYAWPLLVDREGNIWVGTSAGIDRFGQRNFTPAPFPPGTQDFALAAGAHGTVWTGSSTQPVMQLDGSQIHTFDIPPNSLVAYRDANGEVYFGTDSGIWKVSETGASHLASLPKNEDDKSEVDAMTKDLHGTWWISIFSSYPERMGIYTWINGQWEKSPVEGLAHALYSDSSGRIWAGYLDNRLAVFDGNQVTLLTAAQGLTIGDAKTFMQHGQFLWIGGSNGLGYMDGWRWKMVGLSDGGSLKNVTGIAFSDQGDMWVNTLYGVFQLPAPEVHEAESNASHAMHFRKFDTLDGLPGTPALQIPLQSVVKGTDGRLWFATENGVVWLDPRQLVSNLVPPPVVIDAIDADGKSYTPQNGLVLPANTKNVHITFSVPSLTMPERVQAKIRLRGQDSDWRDVGQQRVASYTNLAPGSYRFDVAAANNDGVWNDAGAHLKFRITPAFYQTLWFKALCALITILAIWQAFSFRVRQVNHQLRIRLETRHAERERIARNLHDTLLQSFPALLLKLQDGVNQLPAETHGRNALNQTIDLARKIVEEGRDQVYQLRSQSCGDLVEALTNFATEQAAHSGMTVDISVKGEEQKLKQEIFEEALFIMQEAILNASKHSDGRVLTISLDYRSESLLLKVQDDGQGIDPIILAAGEKPGHWGLIGMRERAKQMSARVSIESQSGQGTCIRLCIPGRVAYLGLLRNGLLKD
ncbi:MAG TPA: two-component regulator propeller domain-containing protein [Dyella sp.]|uniref:sensor histidine kinase n=1 Tax=Dyella sp. TaxID=1869338 RepID=UPI002C628992|nr:two-component regulator propeller domain-containing protein [Dyella sp.]HTV87168.1 two-component regulator propeller domain-containing protein [Dyella sp.]